jgi:predicted site-specific integrase-resolvase
MQTRRKTLGPAADQGATVRMMATEQVVVWLQVAQKTLRNWRSAGIGPPAVKLHGIVRYHPAAVAAGINETSNAAA